MRELNLLQVSEDVLYRPFDTLSNGEQTKVLLAALFLKENSFLLIDEPTNHLDVNARKIVGDYLNSKKGFILVSHDRNFLDSCVDHILSINRNNIEIQRGNFSSWLANKEAQDNFERNENEKLKKDIKRLSNAAKRTSDWSDKVEASKYGNGPVVRGYIGHKSAKMMKRAKSQENRIQTALKEKSKLLKNTEIIDSLKIFSLKFHSDHLITLGNVSVKYGNKKLYVKCCFQINKGDRIVLNGKNGCGKSSILKLLYGDDIEYRGEITKNNQLKISYIPQDSIILHGSLTEYAENHQIDESLFKTILRKLDFSRTQLEKNIENLSAGQRKKVLISGSLCQQSAFIHLG